MEIDDNNFYKLRGLAESGKIQIGVHTAGTAQFFDKGKKEMSEIIGEPIFIQRYSILSLLYISSLTFFASIYFAIKAFNWWSIIAIAIGLFFIAYKDAFAKLGKQRIIPSSIFLTVSVLIVLIIFSDSWTELWFISIFITIYLYKLRYYVSQHLIRYLVINNYRALKYLEGNIVSIREIELNN